MSRIVGATLGLLIGVATLAQVHGQNQAPTPAPVPAAAPVSTPGAQEPSRLVKAWAALIQAMDQIEQFAAIGELSAIHNEDFALASALAILRRDTRLDTPARQEELNGTLTRCGRQIGDVHEAADAFNLPDTRARLDILRAAYRQLQGFYAEDVLAPARRLASVTACPMHRDVVGTSTSLCSKCGMALDQPVRVSLLSVGGQPAQHTVRAAMATDAPLAAGETVAGTLRLTQLTGAPLLLTDLRVVHTQRIHLLVVDPTLTDYHHLHPQPTSVPGEYAFTFTPATSGPYRAWADVRTTYAGFQEYAMADLPGTEPAPAGQPAVGDRRVTLRADVGGLRYALVLGGPAVTAGDVMPATLRVTDNKGRPFTRLEPVMDTFAHLVAFNEDWQTVLHLHPKGAKTLKDADRGGPELEFQIYATKAGFYRLFAQVQIDGRATFVPFGLTVGAATPASAPASKP